jgi:tRNA-dihydrouridine synthase B
MPYGGFIARLLDEKILLAPLAGYTDYPYRRLLSEFDAPFICTEMLSCDAVERRNPSTMKMLERPEGGHLDGVQFFGSNPETMAGAGELVESLGFRYIDINMGCTVWAITRNGAGVSLMNDPEEAGAMVSELADRVSIPVTCKIRLGENSSNINAVELSMQLEEAGASAITVHGRSGDKRFAEQVNYSAIKEVVEAVDIPVVGNGDVSSGEDALHMLESTGVDAVMPGRGLVCNPWIIEEIRSALIGESFSDPSLVERKQVCRRHMEYLVDFYGEEDGVFEMKKILPKYFKGAVHAVDLRKSMVWASSYLDMLDLLDKLTESGDQIVFNRHPIE